MCDITTKARRLHKRNAAVAQAKANRGILYVDEVNLLDDGLVDVVLDSAASGVNTVEREGISIAHPARFIMIGSGNPSEVPQLFICAEQFAVLQAAASKSLRWHAACTKRLVACHEEAGSLLVHGCNHIACPCDPVTHENSCAESPSLTCRPLLLTLLCVNGAGRASAAAAGPVRAVGERGDHPRHGHAGADGHGPA